MTQNPTQILDVTKPRILVNATTLVVGGGIQIGISLIQHAIDVEEIVFIFCVSQAIFDGLSPDLQKNERIRVFPISPARIFRGHKSRSILKKIERQMRPDIVYTLGLPSYTRFRTPEVGRYTNPWEISPTPLAWSVIPYSERITLWLLTQYRHLWASRADFFETQTEVAKNGIMRLYGLPEEKVKVVPNAPNPIFISDTKSAERQPKDDCVRVFCLSAAYRHKNLGIIPEVAACLKKSNPQSTFNFILTLPHEEKLWMEIKNKCLTLGVSEMVTTVGPLKLKECFDWYGRADIVYMPTLLEVFSATYVEAMAMGKPIVTGDLDFSHSVCGEAAMYYNPISPEAAAEAILKVIGDSAVKNEMVEKGRIQLQKFPNPESKHMILMEWLQEVVRGVRSQVNRK